ncbi:MAG TPA: PDZ domain-containing protein [Rhizomicrobium sp.]|jgi:predicted metalloprotease with PDZ domain
MTRRLIACSLVLASAAMAASGPQPLAMPAGIPAPRDVPYPGTVKLAVDATDIVRGVFRVHETIPLAYTGDVVLLLPKWLPGNHGPSGQIDKIAGLTVHAGAAKLAWVRDVVDVYAFHVAVPNGVKSIDVDFEYLSPVDKSEGRIVMTGEMLNLQWDSTALYPAGYFSRDILFAPSVKLPPGWKFATALDRQGAGFKPVPFNTLVDSPLFAGKYYAQIDLDPGAKTPVHLDMFADQPDELTMNATQLQAHRNLVQQAYKAFGSHHYDHYDFLFAMTDRMGGIGLEHHRSSEDGTVPNYFKEWDKRATSRSLLSHEFTHSWNGKFRRPADLWTPNFNVPMRDSLLWVYEGQTQFWGDVLAARSGLWSKQQGLDALAFDAASFADARPGRIWRSVADTTTDPISTMRRPIPWRSWQRSEDYYGEGELIWLDADTLIREKTGGKKSLDDFAHGFFGIDDGSYVTATYTFDDVVRALNAVAPYDWAGFLHARVDGLVPSPLDGIKRGGYHLVYTDVESDFVKGNEKNRKMTDFLYSLGMNVDNDGGAVGEVLWDGPAFKAGVTVGAKIIAVNGVAYESERLKDAVKAAKTDKTPIQLLLKRGDIFRTVAVDYHGGLRYPHLERAPNTPALLDDVLAARK